ncbi:hypothetical protein GJ744_011515 [Endocarpon pusillum]|uniref:Uncharacterized protein n=1 Tax=Endocarpon pusillum TaxID=364733 RepID=A0A8H7AGI4_9EURO|nr:hypothetical protein GJ744_011515 [Endocarpon pusillum]
MACFSFVLNRFSALDAGQENVVSAKPASTPLFLPDPAPRPRIKNVSVQPTVAVNESVSGEVGGSRKRLRGRGQIWDMVEKLCEFAPKDNPLRTDIEGDIRLKRAGKRQKHARQSLRKKENSNQAK